MDAATLYVSVHPAEVAIAEDATKGIPGVKLRRGQLVVPHHAAPFVDAALQHVGVNARGSWSPPPPTAAPWEAIHGVLVRRGEFKAAYLDGYMLAYQKAALGFSALRRGTLLHHPTGSGKTLSAIAWALLASGTVVVVTRVATCVQFTRQVAKYTHLEAFALRSAVHARKRDRWSGLDAYLAWCQERDQRPFIVTGIETITSFAETLRRLRPHSMIFDESHLLASHKRWDATPLAEPPTLAPREAYSDQETYDEERQKRDALAAERAQLIAEGEAQGGFVKESGGALILFLPAENRTRTAFELAKRAQRVLLTTATPIRDRVRDLYAQITLLEPYSWGSWTDWSNRYCDPHALVYHAQARDTTGLSNGAELVARLKCVMHTVSAPEVRKHLPGLRRESLYVAPDQMVELTEAENKRFLREAADAQKRGASAVLEVRIAEAATRCRKAIIDRIEDHVLSGHKVTVFTVRKWLAKLLVGHLRGRLRNRALVIEGTGDDAQGARQEMLDAYVGHAGAAVLVGTGHAWGTSVDGLQCSNAAFFLGHPYEPGELDQWEGRFPRLGQGEPITIYYVIGEGTVLERFASIVLDKLPEVEQIADSGSLRGVADILGGTADPEALAASILAKLGVT